MSSIINDIPIPEPGQEWTIEASEEQGIGRSPCFNLALPCDVGAWLLEGTLEDGGDRRLDIKQRLVWVMESAVDSHSVKSKPQISLAFLFSKWGSPWRVWLDAEQTYNLRMWARRVEMEPPSLLAALVCEAYEKNNGAPLRPAFSLDFT